MSKMMKMDKVAKAMKIQRSAISLLILLVLVVGIPVYNAHAILYYHRYVPNTGSVKVIGVDIFWDEALTQNVTVIDWGLIEPGQNVTKAMWLSNSGNAPINVTLTTLNWNPPEADFHIHLVWDAENQTIAVDAKLLVTLTLIVDADIQDIENFSFDIIVIGEG